MGYVVWRSVASDQNNPRKSVQTILIEFLNCEK